MFIIADFANADNCISYQCYSDDVYGSGSYGMTDMGIVIEISNYWLISDMCTDIDGNGIVNFIDYAIILRN